MPSRIASTVISGLVTLKCHYAKRCPLGDGTV